LPVFLVRHSPICLALWLTVWTCRAEPYLPKDAAQPLERLRATAFDPAQHQMRDLRAQLTREPTNAVLAEKFVRCCIDKYRTEADPRYLGRAQAALAPWWNQAAPPVELLVWRATIKQSQHEFTASLADLETALRLAPRNGQAWLTRATVLTALGDYAQARRACAPLAELAPGLLAVTAAANVTCLTGGAERGCALLRRALEGNPSAGVSEKLWALTLLAETSARLGHDAEAEIYFKDALLLGQRDPYLLGAYADYLLQEGRAAEAVRLLRDEIRADGLLLRLALAESAMTPRPSTCGAHIAALQARFEAGRMRGDFVHQREEARFRLCLLHQPEEALRLAQANWRVQRELADARILIEAARADGQPEAARPALDFVKTNKIETVDLR
jgi:tetratricopeptide (TPR) repeat protein